MPREFMHIRFFTAALITRWAKLLGEHGESFGQVKGRRELQATTPTAFCTEERHSADFFFYFFFRCDRRQSSECHLCLRRLMTVNIHFRIKRNAIFFPSFFWVQVQK